MDQTTVVLAVASVLTTWALTALTTYKTTEHWWRQEFGAWTEFSRAVIGLFSLVAGPFFCAVLLIGVVSFLIVLLLAQVFKGLEMNEPASW